MTSPRRIGSSTSKIGDSDDCHFDFVFIEKDRDGRITDDEESYDDNSYDYCDDACSMLSDHNDESGDDGYSISEITDDGTSSSPATGLKDSGLTVPSVLMKDLDEAHEAAKLIGITDPDEATDLELPAAADDKESSEKQVSESSKSVSSSKDSDEDDIQCIPNEESSVVPSTLVNQSIKESEKNTAGPTIIIWSPLQGENGVSSTSTAPRLVFTKLPEKVATKQEEKFSSTDKNANKMKNVSAPSVSISRTSNKKRRKKLKMLKKAQAASAAAERFQQQSGTTNGKSAKVLKRTGCASPKKQLTPSRCGSKKVANIAVSCAIESMSSYREELSRQQEKQQKQVTSS